MQTLDPPARVRNVRVVRAPAPRRFRTAWVSDVHLGTRSSNAGAFLEFLRDHEFETLYIVGDLIDVCRCGAEFIGRNSTTTSSRNFSAKRARVRASSTSRATTMNSSPAFAATTATSPLR